jgi:polysaccharide export outer membrane protein
MLRLLLVVHGGCAGMRLDEGSAEARARAHYGPGADEQRYRVQTLNSKVVSQLAAERSWAKGNPMPDPLAKEAENYIYRVAPFDVLSVTVWDHPELTIPAGEFRSAESVGNLVLADGTIFYPYVGSVEVAGKTLSEIRTLLTQKLSVYVRNPQLDVRIAAFRGRKVQVAGEVIAPSTLPITDVKMRIQDAISMSRGPTPEADLQRVTLTRDGSVYQLNMLAVYELGDSSQNWLLKDGDILYVPDRRQTSIVIVMGEVKTPSVRVMNKGRMSLAEALGDNGGLDPIAADPSDIYLIRGDYDAPSIYRLDASSADAFLLAVQLPLRPRDVVYVSTAGLTRFSRVMAQILPTIQGLWQTFDITFRSVVRP